MCKRHRSSLASPECGGQWRSTPLADLIHTAQTDLWRRVYYESVVFLEVSWRLSHVQHSRSWSQTYIRWEFVLICTVFCLRGFFAIYASDWLRFGWRRKCLEHRTSWRIVDVNHTGMKVMSSDHTLVNIILCSAFLAVRTTAIVGCDQSVKL